MRRGTPIRFNEDGEPEKLCGRCQEWWPFDDEFFSRNSLTKKLSSPCKACIAEIRTEAAKKPCNVSGCEQPRYGRTSAYCRQHHYELILRKPLPKRQNKAVAL